MSVPKSVIKVNKKGVKYTSSADRCSYFIFELSRAALRDVGRFVKKVFKYKFYGHFDKIRGDAGAVTQYNVISGKNTLYPRVEIGVKNGNTPGFYGYFQEFGSSKTPKLGFLTKSVNENIAEIVKIESQYLSALTTEARVLELIDERTMDGENDE